VGHHLSGTGLHVLRAWHAAADSMRVGLGMIATPAAAPAAASPASADSSPGTVLLALALHGKCRRELAGGRDGPRRLTAQRHGRRPGRAGPEPRRSRRRQLRPPPEKRPFSWQVLQSAGASQHHAPRAPSIAGAVSLQLQPLRARPPGPRPPALPGPELDLARGPTGKIRLLADGERTLETLAFGNDVFSWLEVSIGFCRTQTVNGNTHKHFFFVQVSTACGISAAYKFKVGGR